MNDEQGLVEKLRKVEALFAKPGTDGERLAAEQALHRIRERLDAVAVAQPPEEIQFSMGDTWSRTLFIALLRRYGLKPYRYRRQRRTTVVVRAPRQFVDETLWPEFQQLNSVLVAHLQQITARVVSEAFSVSDAEVEERETRMLSCEEP